ncbi:hypothetical protein [Staphylococcus epidermidis]|uniref:hypothetical protein n=1 Tax=Staphylococcus epidermidis TaxID=1282 RepID=UPI001F263BD6|nr:hypothetical protein [Staphylococcus epidermidis]MCF7581251.1 hypothetical protein [Staphylococcus epidermidis]MDU0487879.1 hypothetical protein [Staphylococcus epidermidis]
MAEPTLDELVAFMKKHGPENVGIITDEDSAVTHFRAQAQVYKGERDAYKKQRDELINDMVEIKKKAEAFDEILDINVDKDELLSEEYIEKVNDVIQKWIFS